MAFGNGSVVPLGQVIVKEYLHVVFEIGGVFTAGVVRLVDVPYRHSQAGGRLRTFYALPGNVHRMEDYAPAGARDVREYAVFDQIMLGTVRRIVRHTNLQPQPIGEPLQVCFEQILRSAVAAATVPKHEQPFRVGDAPRGRLVPTTTPRCHNTAHWGRGLH